jgi:5-methylcytosine-specific restriction endonuclease McrA
MKRKWIPRKVLPPKPCEECGAVFAPRVARQKYCGGKCRFRVVSRKAWARRPPTEKTCANCGSLYHGRQNSWCSEACRHFLYRQVSNRCDARRRARLRGCSMIESFKNIEVYNRDGWVCGICKGFIDSALKSPHPDSASIDHIVPLSRGGTHTMDNVRAAHRGCNSRKKDRIPGEQYETVTTWRKITSTANSLARTARRLSASLASEG